MGGSGSDSATSSLVGSICQICLEEDHLADRCPFFTGPPCDKAGCDGFFKVWTSKTPQNPDKKFFRCSDADANCAGFKWVSDAVDELKRKRGWARGRGKQVARCEDKESGGETVKVTIEGKYGDLCNMFKRM